MLLHVVFFCFFLSLLNHGRLLMIELDLLWRGAGCFNSAVAGVLAYSIQIA